MYLVFLKMGQSNYCFLIIGIFHSESNFFVLYFRCFYVTLILFATIFLWESYIYESEK